MANLAGRCLSFWVVPRSTPQQDYRASLCLILTAHLLLTLEALGTTLCMIFTVVHGILSLQHCCMPQHGIIEKGDYHHGFGEGNT